MTQNEKRLGQLQKEALKYARHWENRWHEFSTEPVTKRVINSLKDRNLVEIDTQLNRFRAI